MQTRRTKNEKYQLPLSNRAGKRGTGVSCQVFFIAKNHSNLLGGVNLERLYSNSVFDFNRNLSPKKVRSEFLREDEY